VVPASIAAIQMDGANLVLSGNGPTNGIYAVQVATNLTAPQWASLATNSFDNTGKFRFTNAISSDVPGRNSIGSEITIARQLS
jgi:hypothetical protein